VGVADGEATGTNPVGAGGQCRPPVSSSAGPGSHTSVMNTQELARELGHPDAQKLLSGSLARLAYIGHDGFPRVIPSGFY
jgi:hypothetical protein